MALLYRASPTYYRSSHRRSPSHIAQEPLLRACPSCSLTVLTPPHPSSLPGSPTFPPAYSSTISLPSPAPSTPTTPSTPGGGLPSPGMGEFRSHDHPTLFVKCAGHVSSAAQKTTLRRGGGLDAGIGVSFASPSRYDFAEPLPTSITAGDAGIRRMAVTPNRAEVFAAIRALDRVKGVLAAACRDRSEGGWQAMLGGMPLGGKGRRMAPGTTLPGKVEEVVVLTRSDYLISSITAPAAQKPWRSTSAGKLRFPSATAGGRNPSVTSLSSSSSSSSSTKGNGGKSTGKRAWIRRKSTKARKSDWDLLFELDLLVQELADRYGVRIYFHKAIVNEASKLAQKGASREEEC